MHSKKIVFSNMLFLKDKNNNMKDFLLFLFHFSPRAAFFCEKKH
ncbi:hypothetical protein DESPIG_01477 [Desulfovibrio piger ATCC 29098]|uniref:Uncharacterized protein n=1 Tax=Desulfovibrio piger ATCC 29098 TaxID=411464 RepID=B6WTS0_9BACT|nr:hypothetical protein DESPIG_01477 [Desulfovibrio piger ATCC 29098]